MSFTHTLNRQDADDNEIALEVEVEFDCVRGYAATLTDPGENDGVEITSVTDAETGKEVELTRHELKEIEQAAMEAARDEYQGRLADKYNA